MDIAKIREQYAEVGLKKCDLADDPIEQFEHWFNEWLETNPYDANAAIVATTSPDGWPSARAILLKRLDERGFVFYTNYRSAKGIELESSARAALCFLWHPVERQVRVVGRVEHLPESESDTYFASRPRGAQIAAWASPQSQVIENRAELEQLASTVSNRFNAAAIPRPSHWGGYLVRPQMVEFWQGRLNRLHDRIRYRKTGQPDDGTDQLTSWIIERLAP